MSPQEQFTPHRRAADLVRGTRSDDEWFDDDVDPADWLPLPKISSHPWNVLPDHVHPPRRWHQA